MGEGMAQRQQCVRSCSVLAQPGTLMRGVGGLLTFFFLYFPPRAFPIILVLQYVFQKPGHIGTIYVAQ